MEEENRFWSSRGSLFVALGTANLITLSRIEILRKRTRINNKNTDNDSGLLGSQNVNW